ncbi:MAG: hypothetical protein A3J24_08725 [Deltaproteobacteria bacterium RIFCSPLOWO2_02_FULL_53_8]|nr:MAG: hypothetical protein A3J24_08725 [Deltaproteobacteria bacterium RIFCSPLOWO2_02_FULL_53_8]
MKAIRKWLRRLTGFSTPLIGISWSPPDEKHEDIPTFDGNICITSGDNQELISFLDNNAGRIVFLNSAIDACMATKAQSDFIDAETIDLEALISGQFNGKTFPLPNNLESIASVAFYFTSNHTLNVSFGGAGVIIVPFNGFFEVSPSLHGGPSTVFHLKETDAPLETRLEYLKRTAKTS